MLGSQPDLEKASEKVARVSCDFSLYLPCNAFAVIVSSGRFLSQSATPRRGWSNSSTSRRNFSVRHFSQPKFFAHVSECCPRTLAPLTWFRQPLLNGIARRHANPKLSTVCQEQPVFKELIGLTTVSPPCSSSFHLWAPTKKAMTSPTPSSQWRPGWFRSYGTAIG